jgi:hypothetical protein
MRSQTYLSSAFPARTAKLTEAEHIPVSALEEAVVALSPGTVLRVAVQAAERGLGGRGGERFAQPSDS